MSTPQRYRYHQGSRLFKFRIIFSFALACFRLYLDIVSSCVYRSRLYHFYVLFSPFVYIFRPCSQDARSALQPGKDMGQAHLALSGSLKGGDLGASVFPSRLIFDSKASTGYPISYLIMPCRIFFALCNHTRQSDAFSS